jgi:LysR family glycine cleavage system transcriptional activator
MARKTTPLADAQLSGPDLLNPKAFPPFAALRAFEAVGRTGGIRRAATVLRLDHTVVSRHIRLLETWLGTPLFHRNSGQLVFTEAGETYYQAVSRTLIELASATKHVMQRDDQHFLRIWSVPGFTAQWLSEQINDFERLSPELMVELRPTDEGANLIMQDADVDIRYYGDDWPPPPGGRGLRYVELARPEVMMVASPALAVQMQGLQSSNDLLDAPLLHEEHHEQWRLWLMRNDVDTSGGLRGPLLWHAHLAIAAARQGRGIALANPYLVTKDLANGSLVEFMVPGSHAVAIGSYYFVTREDRWSAPAIVKLRRFLQSRVL